MSLYQIGAVCLLVAVLAWNYMPAIRLPTFTRKTDALRQIEQVLAIKSSSTDPKVQEACQALLQALIH